MAITLQCPRLSCRTVLQVPETVRGKRVRCGECGVAFIVPTTGTAPPVVKKPSPEKAQK